MSGHARPSARGSSTLLACLLAVLLAACSASADGSPAVRTGEPPTDRIPVIIDSDFDISDLAAIAVLLRDPGVDVRAIAIDGTGLVDCQSGRLLARYLLDELGSPDIPFGCGRETGGSDAHPFPDAWRAVADGAYGLDIPPQPEAGVPRDAVEVIRAAVDASPSAPTIVALGPLTNLEDAFAADDTLADRLAGVHAMLGTVDAPGNVFADGLDGDDPLEWNAYADPSAVEAVLASGVPVSLVPLDATDDVPVPPDLDERLQTDHQAAGADLLHELLVRNPERLRSELGQQLWDELAALTVTDPDLVNWDDAAVTVGDDGRLIRDETGATVRFATSADRPAVERALLDALRRGEPRATPFTRSGQLAVSFDGSSCSISGTSDQPGLHELTYQGPAGAASGALIVGFDPSHRWDDVVTTVASLDPTASPPPWLQEGPTAFDSEGRGAPITASGALEDGQAGVICVTGEGADTRYAAGGAFPVGDGAIVAR